MSSQNASVSKMSDGQDTCQFGLEYPAETMASNDEEPEYDARDYICYSLLSHLDAEQNEGRSIVRTQFLKLSCIADRILKEDYDRDVELPRYWYQYGEILNETPLNSTTYNVSYAEWDDRTRVVSPAPGITTDAFDVDPTEKEDIDRVVGHVARKFANDDSDSIKDHQYEQYAPTSFIQAFDEFREYIGDQEAQNTSLSDFGDNAVPAAEDEAKEKLDALLTTYPEDQYSTMYKLFLRWEDTTRLLLDHEDFDQLEPLLEDFWETFSQVELRHHHEQHTPNDQKLRWRSNQDDLVAGFRSKLSEVRDEVLLQRETSGVLDSMTETGFPEEYS